jgi:hypothetical protein
MCRFLASAGLRWDWLGLAGAALKAPNGLYYSSQADDFQTGSIRAIARIKVCPQQDFDSV